MILVTICIKDSKYSQRSRSESHANRPKLRKIKFQKLTKKGMKQWEYYSEKNLFERDVAKSRSNLVYFPLKNLRKSGGHEKPRLGVGRPKTDRTNLCESLVYCQRLNTVSLYTLLLPPSSSFPLSFTLTLVRLVRCTIYRFLRPRFLYTRVD